MSTQRFRLHRALHVAAALIFAAALLSSPASAAGSPAAKAVRQTAQRPISQRDVDPWDDDLPGKKTPLSIVTTIVRALVEGRGFHPGPSLAGKTGRP